MHQPASESQPGPRHLRILLVEPDTATRERIELELSVRGHSVVGCADGHVALAAFHDNAFHLVMISRRLPGNASLLLCRDLRTLPGVNDTSIVAFSNAASEHDRDVLIRAGADDYVTLAVDAHDLGERLDRIERTLHRPNQSETAAGKGASERFVVINPNGTIREAAAVVERLLGFPPEALTGVNVFGFFHSDDAPQLLSIVAEAFASPGQTRAVEVRVRRDGDSWGTISVSATNRLADPAVQGIAFDLRGPNVRVDVEDQVTRAAMHDRVTDLPNRGLFLDRVDHALARAARRQQAVVVMSVDFNDFQTPDSQPGALPGEGLVIAVAQRLRSCLRTSDTAARLGNDQFGLLLEELDSRDNVEIVVNRIVRAMAVPFHDGGSELTLTPHIGIAIGSPTRNRAVDLLRDAGIARAWARVQGSGSHVTFDPSMQPPDDEPATSEFAASTGAIAAAGVTDRLDAIQERIDSIEQRIEQFSRVNV